ncbi:unnamed protein product [Clonostachys solani]|uniref:Uncharacterized protein n=1 Tax=Clonostachys solani TaxID=160281 RepID=A0A9N9Z056_9HYPO|nr:unnamed protein product [Clonostachys solani]
MIPISSALLSFSPSRDDELVLSLFPVLVVDEDVCSGPFVMVITDVTPLLTICVLIAPGAVVRDSVVAAVTASDLRIWGRNNDPEETADTKTVCVTTDTVTVSVTVNAPVELAITAEPMLV